MILTAADIERVNQDLGPAIEEVDKMADQMRADVATYGRAVAVARVVYVLTTAPGITVDYVATLAAVLVARLAELETTP